MVSVLNDYIKSEWVFSSIFKLVSLMSRSTKSVTDSDESQLRHGIICRNEVCKTVSWMFKLPPLLSWIFVVY